MVFPVYSRRGDALQVQPLQAAAAGVTMIKTPEGRGKFDDPEKASSFIRCLPTTSGSPEMIQPTVVSSHSLVLLAELLI